MNIEQGTAVLDGTSVAGFTADFDRHSEESGKKFEEKGQGAWASFTARLSGMKASLLDAVMPMAGTAEERLLEFRYADNEKGLALYLHDIKQVSETGVSELEDRFTATSPLTGYTGSIGACMHLDYLADLHTRHLKEKGMGPAEIDKKVSEIIKRAAHFENRAAEMNPGHLNHIEKKYQPSRKHEQMPDEETIRGWARQFSAGEYYARQEELGLPTYGMKGLLKEQEIVREKTRKNQEKKANSIFGMYR